MKMPALKANSRGIKMEYKNIFVKVLKMKMKKESQTNLKILRNKTNLQPTNEQLKRFILR